MKKIITPIIYSTFLFAITGISVGVEILSRATGIIGEYIGVIDLPSTILFTGSILIFGIPLFWLANHLLQLLEKIPNPTIYDHIRQSLLYYLMIIYTSTIWIAYGFSGNEEDGYFLLWLGISLVAIVINWIFLFRRRKPNVT